MTTELPHLKPTDTVEYCMELLTKNNIRYLPVFDENNLAGIISISDVVKQTVLVQQETIEHLDSYINSK
jgi:predicted transcriptional regulator